MVIVIAIINKKLSLRQRSIVSQEEKRSQVNSEFKKRQSKSEKSFVAFSDELCVLACFPSINNPFLSSSKI